MENLNRNQYFDKAGIYIIKSNISNKFYIGSSNNLYKRINQHIKNLDNNKHTNKHLQNYYNKYGKDSLYIEIIECILDNKNRYFIFEREQYYLDILYATNCFNNHNQVCFLIKNEIQNKKHSVNMKNWWKNNPQHKVKARENIKKALLIRKEKQKITPKIAWNKNINMTLQTKNKISQSLKNNGRNILKCKKICQYDINNNFIKEWDAGVDAALFLTNNVTIASNIYNCCKNKRKTAIGFIWKYKEN